MADIKQIGPHDYYREPALDNVGDFIQNTNNTDQFFHVCMKRRIKGVEGPAEVLTMALVDWCYTRGVYYCSGPSCGSEFEKESNEELWAKVRTDKDIEC